MSTNNSRWQLTKVVEITFLESELTPSELGTLLEVNQSRNY